MGVDREFVGAAAVTTLSAGLNAGVTSFTITDATGWPTGAGTDQFVVVVSPDTATEEKILCESRSGTTVTVATSGRGYDGTTDQNHASAAPIRVCIDTTWLQAVNEHYNDVAQDQHTQYLNTARHDLTARHAFGAALGTPSAAADISTAASAGASGVPARDDHVHKIGTGAINASGMFAAGVVDAAAIAADAVGSSEIATDAVGTAEIAADAVTKTEIAAAARYKEVLFVKAGGLQTGTGTYRWYTPVAVTIVDVWASVGTAPTGQAVIVDVNNSGITIFTTQANRPQIAAAGNFDASGAPDGDVTLVAATDYVTVDIDQVGSGTAGSDLVVGIRYYET